MFDCFDIYDFKIGLSQMACCFFFNIIYERQRDPN